MNHYSQNDEQEFILKFFNGRKGRLLDIGAFDGVTFSNTRALIESGWYGCLIEPDPRNFCKLMDSYIGRGHDVDILNAAVSNDHQELAKLHIDLTPERGWSSTIVEAARGGVLKEAQINNWVVAVHPEYVWDVFSSDDDVFNLISLDAEWMDFDILKAFPKSMLSGCELLVIEPRDLNERENMRAWLLAAGFKTAHETPENLLVENLHSWL